MNKKNEHVESIDYYKKQAAALKGVNAQRGKKIKELEQEIFSKKTQIARLEQQVHDLAEKLRRAQVHADEYEYKYEEVMKLPWYKKMFL